MFLRPFGKPSSLPCKPRNCESPRKPPKPTATVSHTFGDRKGHPLKVLLISPKNPPKFHSSCCQGTPRPQHTSHWRTHKGHGRPRFRSWVQSRSSLKLGPPEINPWKRHEDYIEAILYQTRGHMVHGCFEYIGFVKICGCLLGPLAS